MPEKGPREAQSWLRDGIDIDCDDYDALLLCLHQNSVEGAVVDSSLARLPYQQRQSNIDDPRSVACAINPR